MLIANFIREEKLTPEEIKDLKSMLDKMQE